MEADTNIEVDIAIIGGGVAGCIAAIALAGSYSVVLIDKLGEPVERIGECLPAAGRRILKQLNLLDGLEKSIHAAGHGPHLTNMGTRSYWGSEQVHIVDPLRNPDGFGWHLDRQAFEVYLRQCALLWGVNCLWPAKLHDCQYEDLRWHLTAISADKGSAQKTYNISAKFVIDASGRQSHFARKLGIERSHFDKLITCWAILPDNEENKLSTISAAELGWWYTAPLPNSRRVLAFQTDSDLVDKSAIKNTGQFIALAHTDQQISKILERSRGETDYRGTVAANSTCLSQVAGQQWVALGDAAMSFDPLSSQGMFNAMAGAVQLHDLIQQTGLIKSPDPKRTEQFQVAYTHQMSQIWEHYTKHKHIFYMEERRWREADFWKRRH